ncbi:MAG: hypothetical protein Q8Q12_06390 [bacterium]|nr:hypothetical protein [bacterium]
MAWDTVLAPQCTYVTRIRFNGKNVALTSTGPLDADVVAKTIIDGSKVGSCVTSDGTENQSCVLTCFTVRTEKAPNGGGTLTNKCKGPTAASTSLSERFKIGNGMGSSRLAGMTRSFGAGGGDAWVIKTDPEGNAPLPL